MVYTAATSATSVSEGIAAATAGGTRRTKRSGNDGLDPVVSMPLPVVGEIEHGVPVPPTAHGQKPMLLPLTSMQAGDSVAVLNITYHKVQNDIMKFRKLNDPEAKFTVRKIDGGFRVWRL